MCRLCLPCCLIHLGIQMSACRCASQTTFPSLFSWFSLSLSASDNLTTQTHTHWFVLCVRSFSRCLMFRFFSPDSRCFDRTNSCPSPVLSSSQPPEPEPAAGPAGAAVPIHTQAGPPVSHRFPLISVPGKACGRTSHCFNFDHCTGKDLA